MSCNINSFRVPKKANRPILDLITDDNDQKQFLQIKIMESFKKSEVSKKCMDFSKFWSIKNPDSEVSYAKRRQSLKIKNQNVVEFYGFLYVKSEEELKSFSSNGKIKIGNVPDSKLGVGSMGVSLSQFADIFHPGDANCYVPSHGILLIIKYLKGRVNYVSYDDCPVEPQPSYDCHIVRNCGNLEANVTVIKAFHSTQVFLYEYSEDAEVIEYPTQLQIIGAVKFTWSKKYIFKTVNNKQNNIIKPTNKRRAPDYFTTDDSISHKYKCISTRSKLSTDNVKHDSIPIMLGDLVVKDSSSQKAISVRLMTKFRDPVPLYNLISDGWEITEVIESKTFIKFFHYMDENNTANILKIYQHKVITLPTKFYEGKTVPNPGRPRHLMYLNMIPNSLSDNKALQRLVNNFNKSNTVGRITTTFYPNVLFYVFPTGKLSEEFGIPKDYGQSLHVILMFSIHPEIGCTNVKYTDEHIIVSETNSYMSSNRKNYIQEPLISHKTLKETAANESVFLKNLYKTLITTTDASPPAVGSDMEIDSDDEKRHIRPRSNIREINGVNKEQHNHIEAQPVLTNSKYKDPPLRIPTSLPSTISMNSPSINWQELASPTHDIDLRPEMTKAVAVSQINILATTTENAAEHRLPSNKIAFPNPPSSTNNSVLQCLPDHQQQTTQQIVHAQNTDISFVPHTQEITPNGHFKLVSLTRNNFRRSNRQGNSRPIRLRTLELMEDIPFISQYKG